MDKSIYEIINVHLENEVRSVGQYIIIAGVGVKST